MRRLSVVMAVAALDTYMHRLIVERVYSIRSYPRKGEHWAEFVLQENGTLDVGTKGKPWGPGEQGWEMPGAPSSDLRKFRFSG